jgi:hypothetical protein
MSKILTKENVFNNTWSDSRVVTARREATRQSSLDVGFTSRETLNSLEHQLSDT